MTNSVRKEAPLRSAFDRLRLRTAVVLVMGLAALAGCSSSGESAQGLPGVAVSPGIDVVATEMAYDPSNIVVEAGEVPVRMVNEGTVIHDLRIEGLPFLLEAEPGATETATVDLEPGTYQFYCSIPGHREAGMEGVLEVR